MAEIRIEQDFGEAVTEQGGSARLVQDFLEAIVDYVVFTAQVRVEQDFLEVVHAMRDVAGVGNVHDEQDYLEVICRVGGETGDYVPPAPLILDCTIAGIINQAMTESGIDAKQVTTRGNLGRHIVRHRAALLGRLAAVWEGVEIGDIEYPMASPISLVNIGEIVMVEARRTSDQQWFRIPVVPMSENIQ